jgi:hypothetical protein
MATETENPPAADPSNEIGQELAPRTAVERLLVKHVLIGVQESERCLAARKQGDSAQDPEWYKDYERASRIFHKNLAVLTRIQSARTKQVKSNTTKPSEPEVKKYELLTHDGSRRAEAPIDTPIPVDTPEEIAESARTWSDVIAYVPTVNRKWAVHLPTGKVVEHVLAGEGTGITDERILRNEPWLRPRDLAAMRACQDAGLLGPFHPFDKLPPGIRRLDELPPSQFRPPP